MIYDKFLKILKKKEIEKPKLNEWLNLYFNELDPKILSISETKDVFKEIDILLKKQWDNTSDKLYKKKWDKGWSELSKKFIKTKNEKDLNPQYLKSKLLKICNFMVKFNSVEAEHKIAELILTRIFEQYFDNVDNIYEFGCGPCRNIIILNKLFKKNLFAFDWADGVKDIVETINDKSKNEIKHSKFNMLKPNQNCKIKINSGVLTVHSMEQIGKNHKNFLNYLLKSDIKISVHIEPEDHFYSKDQVDSRRKLFHNKRGYLTGFFKSLSKLEQKNILKIIHVQKLHFGSLMHDPYIIFIWKPI